MSINEWQRVNKQYPCPICSKPDWCLYTGPNDSPMAVICARVESSNRCGESGWLHRLRDFHGDWESPRLTFTRSVAVVPAPTTDFAKLAADSQWAATPDAVANLATSLGVSAGSLRRLAIGWSSEHKAWTFPMQDVSDNVLGIRLRLPEGRKMSIRGGREGLFIPGALDQGSRLLITEGPTDCAALLDLGFNAVGRPSCNGGVKLLVDLMQKYRPTEVVIVADGDEPGQRGAESLATVMCAYSTAVRIITPPVGIKDARGWKKNGATAAEVQAVIDAAPVRKLSIEIQYKQMKVR
jgi:hypothetical protein